jgi:hypothetical protein
LEKISSKKIPYFILKKFSEYAKNIFQNRISGLKLFWKVVFGTLLGYISHGQPAARGPYAALEALECGPSTDSEKRYFGAKSIRI